MSCIQSHLQQSAQNVSMSSESQQQLKESCLSQLTNATSEISFRLDKRQELPLAMETFSRQFRQNQNQIRMLQMALQQNKKKEGFIKKNLEFGQIQPFQTKFEPYAFRPLIITQQH